MMASASLWADTMKSEFSGTSVVSTVRFRRMHRKPSFDMGEDKQEKSSFFGDKMYRAKELADNGEFWKQLLTETQLADWIKNHYSVGGKALIEGEETMEEAVE